MIESDTRKRIRVCHIITGLEDGGAESVLYRLCLNTPGVQPYVISLMSEGKYGAMLRDAGIEVYSIGMQRGRPTAIGLTNLLLTLRKIRPDVVQTWMYHADLIGGVTARLAGCRNVIWGLRHCDTEFSKSRSTFAIAWLCARISYVVPRLIVSCSQRGKEAHLAFGYSRKRMIVIPNGYDTSRFAPDPDAGKRFRMAIGVGPQERLVGFVARWHPLKDHQNLLAALKLLVNRGAVNWRCILVGTNVDENNQQLTHLIARSGLQDRIILLGRRPDVSDIMNALDVHILASKSEAFPNVVAEAMACGTPCVVTDVGDASLIVGDTGWVVPPQDPARLAEMIEAALGEIRHSEIWQARVLSCRQRIVAHFSLSEMVDRYHAMWTQLEETRV